jgi:hypothetical protein
MRGDTEQQLREAINPRVYASDPIAAHHVALAREGSALDIARQVFVDRERYRPVDAPLRAQFSREDVLARWHKGAPIPTELADEFAAYLTAHTARRLAMSELERRLRATMWAQLKLAESSDENDKRMALAFGRWHRELWGVADIPRSAPAGQDQPFEKQLMAAVQRRVR